MTNFEVDTFSLPEAQLEFAERRAAVAATIGAFGLHGQMHDGERPAQLFGSAALAEQGIDSHVGPAVSTGRSKFDIDAVVSLAMFTRLQCNPGFYGPTPVLNDFGNVAEVRRMNDAPLPLCVATGKHLGFFIGDSHYTGEPHETSILSDNDVLVTPAAIIAAAKVNAGGRIKDFEQIIKAHTVAYNTGHPIVEDKAWRQAVGTAGHRLTEQARRSSGLRRIFHKQPPHSTWATQLIKADFNHPAFESVDIN